MKYNVIKNPDGGFDVFTEDGGVAEVSVISDGNYTTTYYQRRLTDMTSDYDNKWTYLAEGKAYVKDWEHDPSYEEALMDALNWLVIPSPDEWVLDEELPEKLEMNVKEVDNSELALIKEALGEMTRRYAELEEEFEQYRRESIKWSVEDFLDYSHITHTITMEQAQMALEDMIRNHDAENGVTWWTIASYIEKYGTRS